MRNLKIFRVLNKPLVELEHMCYNVLIMASVSYQPASLPVHMSARRQMAFVPFRSI